MEQKLKNRLLRTALLSSPILGLYGVTPVYIFNKIPADFILFAAMVLTVIVFIFWLINIYVLRITGNGEKSSKRYLLSYTLTFVFHFTFILVGRNFKFVEIDSANFVAYPVISVIAINTVIIIICNSILLAQKKESAELEVEQLKVSNLEAQKQVLMQQLQPHFLFNTLSVLKSLIKENPDEAEDYSVKLSEFLRYSVQVHKSDLVTVEEELKFTNDYIELQKVRFGDSLICYINIPGEVLQYKMPAYGLQTLVENAIKHNTFTEKKPLCIRIGYEAGIVRVWNNKMHRKLTETSGTGLKNLNERCKIIMGTELEITDNNDEFCVAVRISDKKQVP
jgi:two-component system, LytTR family, sensor kinase